MEHQEFCEPKSGNLVCHLPRDVTIVYYLHLGQSRDCWKGINKDKNSRNALNDDFG